MILNIFTLPVSTLFSPNTIWSNKKLILTHPVSTIVLTGNRFQNTPTHPPSCLTTWYLPPRGLVSLLCSCWSSGARNWRASVVKLYGDDPHFIIHLYYLWGGNLLQNNSMNAWILYMWLRLVSDSWVNSIRQLILFDALNYRLRLPLSIAVLFLFWFELQGFRKAMAAYSASFEHCCPFSLLVRVARF